MRSARVLVSATVRFALILVLVAVLVALPLLSVRRAECGRDDSRYRVELPWKESDPPRGCDSEQNGWEILREEVGLD